MAIVATFQGLFRQGRGSEPDSLSSCQYDPDELVQLLSEFSLE